MNYEILQTLSLVEAVFTILAEVVVTALGGMVIVLLIREAKNHDK